MAKTTETRTDRRPSEQSTGPRNRPPNERTTSIEDACTCTVCREQFAGTERPTLVPRILSGCGHTICTGCLIRLIGSSVAKARDEIICPVCRKVTRVPNGDVTNLPNNWSVMGLIPCLDYGATTSGNYDPPVCQMGCNENPIVYRCKQCQEHMCCVCAENTVCRSGCPHCLEEVHPHAPAQPSIMALPNREHQDRLCHVHNAAVQLVCCAKQNALLCLVCREEPEHKGHDHVSLNAFSERKNEALQILLRDLRRKQRDFVYGFNISKRTQEELMQEKERIHNQLKKVFGQLEEAIRIRKEALTEQIDRVIEQKLKFLDQEAATMSLTSEDLKQLSSQVEKLTMGAPFEVVMQADEIIERGETMLKDSRTADPLHSSQVVFDTAGLDDLQASMLKFGKHKYAPGPVENLQATVKDGKPTSAVLTWDQPNRKWDTGDAERYTVEWRTVANDENQDRQIYFQQIHSDTKRHLQVCDLTKGLEHKFRVAAVNQAGQGPFVTSQIIKVNEPSFVWDSNRCHASVRLSNENCTASVGDNAHWICAGGSKVLETGRHYWELQLDRYGIPSPNKKIVAGVVHATGLDPHCWQRNRTIIGLYYSPFNTQSWSLALQTGRKLSQFTHSSGITYCQRYRFHEGDRVGILVDLDRQTLEYFHNGQSLGIAFEDVKGPVIPAVSFCHHKRVTLHYPPVPKSHEAVERPRIITRSNSHAGDKLKKRYSESSECDSTSSVELS